MPLKLTSTKTLNRTETRNSGKQKYLAISVAKVQIGPGTLIPNLGLSNMVVALKLFYPLLFLPQFITCPFLPPSLSIMSSPTEQVGSAGGKKMWVEEQAECMRKLQFA